MHLSTGNGAYGDSGPGEGVNVTAGSSSGGTGGAMSLTSGESSSSTCGDASMTQKWCWSEIALSFFGKLERR